MSGAAPGRLYRLDVSASPLDRELFKNSTHAFGLAEAVELSRALGTLPARVLVFGVEVKDLTTGIGLSPEVKKALPVLVEQVLARLFLSRTVDARGGVEPEVADLGSPIEVEDARRARGERAGPAAVARP